MSAEWYSYNGKRFKLTDLLTWSNSTIGSTTSSITASNDMTYTWTIPHQEYAWRTYSPPSYEYARIYEEQSKILWKSFYKDLERNQIPWIRKISLNKNTTII